MEHSIKTNEIISRLMNHWSAADSGATTISQRLLADAVEALRHSAGEIAELRAALAECQPATPAPAMGEELPSLPKPDKFLSEAEDAEGYPVFNRNQMHAYGRACMALRQPGADPLIDKRLETAKAEINYWKAKACEAALAAPADLRNTISNAIYGYGAQLEDHVGTVDAIAKALASVSQPASSEDELKKLNAALADEKRKTLELSRVYDERGRQIERLELALSRKPGTTAAELTVWYGSMPESNGKSNFTAILTRKDAEGLAKFEGFTIARSEYPDRVRYDADCVRALLGEIDKEPFILDYDGDKHSGYVVPSPAASAMGGVDDERIDALIKENTKARPVNDGDGVYYVDTFDKHGFARALLALALKAGGVDDEHKTPTAEKLAVGVFATKEGAHVTVHLKENGYTTVVYNQHHRIGETAGIVSLAAAKDGQEPSYVEKVVLFLNHLEDVLDDENFAKIDSAQWAELVAPMRHYGQPAAKDGQAVAVPAQQWIPAGASLPPKDQYVWASWDGAGDWSHDAKQGLARHIDGMGWQPMHSMGWDWRVTHWMPLPSAPSAPAPAGQAVKKEGDA